MKLEDVTVSPDIIGLHGIGSTKVLEVDTNIATLDLGTWVDEAGVGESHTGAPVEKEFPSTVVLLSTSDFDPETRLRHAEEAYVGQDGTHSNDRYEAVFECCPPTGSYSAFFPHGLRTQRPLNAEPVHVHHAALEELDVDDIAERLTVS